MAKIKKMHPKIEALRASVGHMPIHRFLPSRSTSVEMTNRSTPTIVRKAKPEDEREIEQYFAVWGVVDDYGTRPMKGCFKKSIDERGPKSSAPGKIVVLDQHRQSMPVCLPSEVKEDEIGLYARYSPDPIPRCDDLIVQIRRGTINNGSYGFNYVWERLEWNEKDNCIDMYECILEELSPVTFGSQRDTFVIRNNSGIYIPQDEDLIEETEEFIKKLPREMRLQARMLITRHTSLAFNQPIKKNQRSLKKKDKPEQRGIDIQTVLKNLKFD